LKDSFTMTFETRHIDSACL